MSLFRVAAVAGAGLAATAAYSFSPRRTPAEAHTLNAGEVARHRVVVVGGGAAGLTVAAQLTRKLGGEADVAVVEPSDFHYYQPWWTMTGTYPIPDCDLIKRSPMNRGLIFRFRCCA